MGIIVERVVVVEDSMFEVGRMGRMADGVVEGVEDRSDKDTGVDGDEEEDDDEDAARLWDDDDETGEGTPVTVKSCVVATVKVDVESADSGSGGDVEDVEGDRVMVGFTVTVAVEFMTQPVPAQLYPGTQHPPPCVPGQLVYPCWQPLTSPPQFPLP